MESENKTKETAQTIEDKEGKTLSPCPFCGGSVELWNTGFGIVKVIECKNCNVRFLFKWDNTGPDIYEVWGKRAPR